MQARRRCPTGATMDRSEEQADPLRRYLRQAIRDDYLAMNSARLASAVATDKPFVERLVHFWANHFAVSVDKLPVIGLAGLLEFEAIRPARSRALSPTSCSPSSSIPRCSSISTRRSRSGPNSQAGQFAAMRGGKQRGLNENLAREIMELHTLGVRTGYSQADVTEFARALTGWTVSGIGRGAAARHASAATPAVSVRRGASRARRPDDHGQELCRSRAKRRRARCCSTSRRARRPRGTSRPSSRGTSPVTIRRQRWSTD